ncbi:hypothetical protein B0920_21165 [Massilia sp. KIM]|uniref:sensor histidine kinase n=1 Tax=Massilia sp. KIM TaxID=1955422 RepID=UPI0009900646|nr:triple tyrosine motif-containing protein [Massilia sp. KIM]OON59795.1 hypothetical protein B0920_21165 [Massilia sp. KIM]
MRPIRFLLALALCLYATLAAASSVLARQDEQSYERRRWGQSEGAPQHSFSMAQTADGMLWFASPAGLHSFDGVRFRQVDSVYGHPIPSPSITSVTRIPGGLALTYQFGGLSLFTREGRRHFEPGRDIPAGSTNNVAVDRDGTIYLGTSTGLLHYRQGKWEPSGADSLPAGNVPALEFDPEGTLWLHVGPAIYRRARGAERFEHVLTEQDPYTSFDQGLIYTSAPGKGFLHLNAPGEKLVRVDRPDLYRKYFWPGPHGSTWSLREDGIVRLAPRADGVLAEAELFPFHPGSSAHVAHALVDREDNLWMVTPDGVERLRRHRFSLLPTGASGYLWFAQPGLGEEMWLSAERKPLVRWRPDGSRRVTGIVGVNAIVRQGPDRAWVGTDTELWEVRGEHERRIALPREVPRGYAIQALAVEGEGRLLVSIVRHGLWVFDGEGWRRDQRLRDLPEPIPISMLGDARGTVWVGLTGSRVGKLTPDGVELLGPEAGLAVGNVLSLLDAGGRVLAGGDLGLAWLDGGRAHPLRLALPGNFQRITGLALDRQGSLWLHSNAGLVRVGAPALRGFWSAPARPVAAELFNFEDGVRGLAAQIRPLPSLALGQDGRLYYATASQVGWIDPAAIPRNPLPPTVLIEALRTRQHSYAPRAGLVLPEGTTALDLDFTATALSIPERARLRYRLDGVDPDWREVERERSASYTNLAPGRYRFQVIAANEDGVWNTEGAQLGFEIAPAFWQTLPFRLACAALLLLALVLLYRWRVAALQRRADARALARMEATLEERGRIARSLHDNLLQAVQALLLRFHMVHARLAHEPELQALVGRSLDQADELVASTRDEVMALRAAPAGAELFAGLAEAAEAVQPGASAMLTLTAEGEAPPLCLEAAAELRCMLREAVLNAVRHARASRIVVRLRFGAEGIEGEVVDDGVGIAPALARSGRAGHWGIAGMRERIGKLGGSIEIGNAAAGGAVVRFSVPGERIYEAGEVAA